MEPTIHQQTELAGSHCRRSRIEVPGIDSGNRQLLLVVLRKTGRLRRAVAVDHHSRHTAGCSILLQLEVVDHKAHRRMGCKGFDRRVAAEHTGSDQGQRSIVPD